MLLPIYLIRHTSVDVPRGVCYGQTDVPLSRDFEAEAESVRETLTSRGLSNPFVLTSPMTRCTRLATYCGYPHADIDMRLLELNFGEWELKRFDLIRDPQLECWYEDYIDEAPTGGESFREQCYRVWELLAELEIRLPRLLADGHDAILLFTHAGVLRAARQWKTQSKDLRHAFDYNPMYGEVLVL